MLQDNLQTMHIVGQMLFPYYYPRPGV